MEHRPSGRSSGTPPVHLHAESPQTMKFVFIRNLNFLDYYSHKSVIDISYFFWLLFEI